MKYIIHSFKYVLRIIKNAFRKMKSTPDYIVFVLNGEYPDIREPKPGFLKRKFFTPKTTLQDLNEQFDNIIYDLRVRGVVLHFRDINMSFSQLQELRSMIFRLKENGKHVVAWSQSYDTKSYYVACAADEIYIQKGGDIGHLGISKSYTFIGNSLNKIGLKMDVVNVSPYKSAMDTFSRSTMSEEVKEMTTWLLESNFKELVAGVAKGRKISEAAAKDLIDNSPYIHKDVDSKAFDGVCNEEQLPFLLKGEKKEPTIMPYALAKKRLLIPPLKKLGGLIAIIRIQGSIVAGHSEKPPFKFPIPVPFLFSRRVGDLTVVQQVRKAHKDKRVKAVLLYIDSGGGSANASEAMASALESLAKDKPVVAVMGTVAASGGYYVATPAQWIVAQPTTITGSIGVISAKIINKDLLNQMLMNREIIYFGENAEIFNADKPFNDKEREIMNKHIFNTYDVFLERVGISRKLSKEEVDKIGGGRVWTGAQAFELGLVDELGGIHTALNRIYKLTGLNKDNKLIEYRESKGYLAPIPHSINMLDYALRGVNSINSSTSLCVLPFIDE